MLQLHDRFNDPLSSTVNSTYFDLRKPLFNITIMFPAQDHNRMIFMNSPILLPLVYIALFYRIGAFFQYLFQKYLYRCLNLVWKVRRTQFQEKSSIQKYKYFLLPKGDFPVSKMTGTLQHIGLDTLCYSV